MSSLIVPSHLAEARQRALKANPAAEIKKRPDGALDLPDRWFSEEKARIRERIGAFLLAQIRITLNQVLIASFVRPTHTPGGLELPDSYRNEDKYQGVAGLVLKLGPRCFENDSVMTWTDDDKYAENDWVMFRRGSSDGVPLNLNGVHCFHFMNERAVRMVIPRPDVVY